ncbi:MAG: elongation factor G [Oscillospiraceae bacterium]|nr:elongation factor G [Oscillospiraceae bacterium]
MSKYNAGTIKNVALAGHSASGKTTLAEALLFKAGELDRLGNTADGNTAMDFDPEEIKRRASISSSVYPFDWTGVKINLLDTPGLFDFAGGMYEGVRAAESVIICVSGRSGVAVGTRKAYKAAQEMKRSRMFFVTQLDTENSDFFKVYEELKSVFGSGVYPVAVPYSVDGKVQCYVNIITEKAYSYDAKGAAKETDMPDLDVSEYKAALTEAIAETNEELLEKFMMDEPFTPDEFAAGIKAGVKDGSITPVYCGSGATMAGADMLLDAMAAYLPSAAESAGEAAVDAADAAVQIACTEDAPLAAFVFKTVADPFVGKLSFIKVISGKLSGDIQPLNTRTGQTERMGKLIYIKGKKQEEAPVLTAGDIGAVTKLADTKTGDSLCDRANPVSFTKTVFPAPTLSMAVKIKSKGDEGKIAGGMARLTEEDPSLSFALNAETRQQLISGMGEQHLDVATSKLKSKFGVDIDLIEPRVPYRETIRKKVDVQGRHKKQTGGSGQFGDVWIEFEPHDGDGLLFESRVVGGTVPRNFWPAVEKGLQEAIGRGVIAGYPVVGLKATLHDGSSHSVDSSEMAFKLAAQLAYRNGIPQASPVLLEPIGNLKVTVPDTFTGDIMGELNKRRGRVLGMNPAEDGHSEIEGEAPMSEMHDFTIFLRAATQGQGSFTFAFERYEQLPQMLEDAVKEAAAKMNEEE